MRGTLRSVTGRSARPNVPRVHAKDFDSYVVALVRCLRAGRVDHVLLEDGDPDTVTVVPGPTRRNLERLVRVLRDTGAAVRVPGEIDVLPFDEDGVLDRGPCRWSLRIDGADTDVLVVDVADGRYGRFYESSRRVEIEPGLAVDVVPDTPVRPMRADATAVIPDLDLTQRDRDRARWEARRRTARTAEVDELSRPRTFATLRRRPG